jgi:hypothetical protein
LLPFPSSVQGLYGKKTFINGLLPLGFVTTYMEIGSAVLQAKRTAHAFRHFFTFQFSFHQQSGNERYSRWICYASLLGVGCVTASLDFFV